MGHAGKLDLCAFISTKDLKVIIFHASTMATLSDLTNRELEILRLVLAGQTNKAIAAEIFISEKTVEFHLDNIYSKIGVRTRLMAGVWALQRGLSAEARETPS